MGTMLNPRHCSGSPLLLQNVELRQLRTTSASSTRRSVPQASRSKMLARATTALIRARAVADSARVTERVRAKAKAMAKVVSPHGRLRIVAGRMLVLEGYVAMHSVGGQPLRVHRAFVAFDMTVTAFC